MTSPAIIPVPSSTAPPSAVPIGLRSPGRRLAELFDVHSLVPLREADESGVATIVGRIDGAKVYAYCVDADRLGHAGTGAARVAEAIELAVLDGAPVLGVWHSAGGPLVDGAASMAALGRMFLAMTQASGRIPQICVVLGPAVGVAACGPALTDIVITDESPDQGMAAARRVVALLARPGAFELSSVRPSTRLRLLRPESPRREYDIHLVIRAVLDAPDEAGGFVELQPRRSPDLVVGFGRLAGRSVGVVADNAIRAGGDVDALGAEKAARFVRMCDALGVPLIVLVDRPRYLPGVSPEWGGAIRRGAKLLQAFAESVVPRVTVLLRRCDGGAYLGIHARSLGATAVFAWPEMEAAQRRTAPLAPRGAESGEVVDQVIEPVDTRLRVATALAEATPKRGRHTNIPW